MAATRPDRGDDVASNDEVDGVVRSVYHPDLAGHRDHHPDHLGHRARLGHRRDVDRQSRQVGYQGAEHRGGRQEPAGRGYLLDPGAAEWGYHSMTLDDPEAVGLGAHLPRPEASGAVRHLMMGDRTQSGAPLLQIRAPDSTPLDLAGFPDRHSKLPVVQDLLVVRELGPRHSTHHQPLEWNQEFRRPNLLGPQILALWRVALLVPLLRRQLIPQLQVRVPVPALELVIRYAQLAGLSREPLLRRLRSASTNAPSLLGRAIGRTQRVQGLSSGVLLRGRECGCLNPPSLPSLQQILRVLPGAVHRG